MMEVNCWMPKTPERDTIAKFPDPNALLVSTTDERAQLRVKNMPSLETVDHPMTERRSHASQIYERTPMSDVMMRKGPMTKKTSTTHDSHYICPLDEAPEECIPPKPPYLICHNTTLKQPEKTHPTKIHDRHGHKFQEKSTLL